MYQAINSYKKTFTGLLSDGYIKSVDGQKRDVDVKVGVGDCHFKL